MSPSRFDTPQPTPEAPRESGSEILRSLEQAAFAESLTSREGIDGIRAWRSIDRRGRGSRQMRKFFDRISLLDRAGEDQAAREEILQSLESVHVRKGEEAARKLSRVEELQALLLEHKLGQEPRTARPDVQRIFERLQRGASVEGETNPAELLMSGKVAPQAKVQWFDSQVASAVRWLERRDLTEARKQAEEPPPDELLEEKQSAPDENLPPPDRDSFAPSMEELERAEAGEPGAYFTISPFYGGYWREGHFDRWDPQTLRWERSPRQLMEAAVVAVDEQSRRVIAGTVRPGQRTALPMAYGFRPDPERLKTHGGNARVLEDGSGGYVVEAEGEGLVSFSIEAGKSSVRLERAPASSLQIFAEDLSEATESLITGLASSTDNQFEKARHLKRYVRKTLTYSNDSSMNAVYRGGKPAGYFQCIEEHKKADCDVANTYFAALLSRLDIPTRMVTGHYVKVKNHAGAAVISSGTGHAWCEVWDGARWRRLDATPPGDPNMDDEEMDERDDDESMEGDFGETEEPISNEELQEMIAVAQKELAEREQSEEERAATAFAEEVECTPEEAKKVLAEIAAARELRDRQGRNIHDRMASEFQKIVQENIVAARKYRAPVRLSRGEELADPVAAVIDIRSGEVDPTGFGRHERELRREQVYGGFDMVMVADKSGSMDHRTERGLARWQEQQRLIFLAMDALNSAKKEFKRYGVRLISPIEVRFALASFGVRKKGSENKEAMIELPLGTEWGPREQYQVWKSLQENCGGGTPDHLGMGLAGQVLEGGRKQAGAKGRLQLVLEYSDGGSDEPDAFARSIASLRNDGVIADAYRGDLADYPDWVAQHIIDAAQKLYPKNVKK